MNIGLLYHDKMPHSLQNYTDNLVRELTRFDVRFVTFFNDHLPENVDMYWDPRGGRSAPPPFFRKSGKPFVATFHGAVHLTLPAAECFGRGIKNMFAGYLQRKKTITRWRLLQDDITAVIAPSYYAKTEFVQHIGFEPDKIFPIHHGVDHEVFCPAARKPNANNYILHISAAYQPVKNIMRIIAAYNCLDTAKKPAMKIVCPGYPGQNIGGGIELIRDSQNHHQLKSLYQNALCFLFPSLRETFGMPILEAMACGIPVITSNITGCSEVAGDAAMMVNPRSTDEIISAMKRLIESSELQKKLSKKGIEHALRFTWAKSAREHLAVFEKILG